MLGPPWREQPQTISYITMSRYDCRNTCVLSFYRNTVNDEADVMSSGKLFYNVRPGDANDRSPTVTRRDRRTLSWLEVDDRIKVVSETACQQRGSSDHIDTEAQSCEELGRR